MKFFLIYQVIAPLLLLPCSCWLWWRRYDGDLRLVFASVSLPIVFAYVIPGIGTNWLRLWEINTRFRVGRFRPYHGLVFGAATSLFAWITLGFAGQSDMLGVVRSAFVLGSVLAFWNWLYDTVAIKVGFIRVYTRPDYANTDAESITFDYAPVMFGTFGFCYGATVRVLEHLSINENQWPWIWPLLLAGHVFCLVTPVVAYVLVSLIRTGESGLRSYERVGHDR